MKSRRLTRDWHPEGCVVSPDLRITVFNRDIAAVAQLSATQAIDIARALTAAAAHVQGSGGGA